MPRSRSAHPVDFPSRSIPAELGFRLPRRPEPLPKCVFVQQDAHVFSVRTDNDPMPAYIFDVLRRVFLHDFEVPYDTLQPSSHIWHCPLRGCEYTADLENLPQSAIDALRGFLPTPEGPNIVFYIAASGPDHFVRVNPDFRKLVVDIIGLRHYEAGHLSQLGLKCVIWGQTLDGNVR